jgi:hypothetical protein
VYKLLNTLAAEKTVRGSNCSLRSERGLRGECFLIRARRERCGKMVVLLSRTKTENRNAKRRAKTCPRRAVMSMPGDQRRIG